MQLTGTNSSIGLIYALKKIFDNTIKVVTVNLAYYIDNNKFKFLENLSIIDLLFHQGSNSCKFLKDVDLKLMN